MSHRCTQPIWPRLGRWLICAVALLAMAAPARAQEPPPPIPPENQVQAWLDAQPGPLKGYSEGGASAAEMIEGAGSYYGVSVRLVLALLEACSGLVSSPAPSAAALRQPFGSGGPEGFAAQIDWAGAELRAGYGPYDVPPTLRFTDGTTLTLTLDQAMEGVAVQRFLAQGRSQTEWRAAYERFAQAFGRYFNNQLPAARAAEPVAASGFLQRPWQAGTKVKHLAYFDHMFPTVDTKSGDNGYVVNYMGRGGVQYDGHDGHDFYFPDQPIGTLIVAAADGVAYARTHRGFGVVIVHPGGYETVYWHLDKFSRRFMGRVDTDKGVAVKAGDVIGSSGKTGFVKGTPHLHFEVRHNGKEVDPYGWYGSGGDPCAAYAACEASPWLWSSDLAGEFDFTPPGAAAASDTTPPTATIAAAPPEDVLLLARPAEQDLLLLGFGQPVREGDAVSLPAASNILSGTGSVAMLATLPDRYGGTSSGHAYLLSTSASPDSKPAYTNTLALRRDELGDGRAVWNFWTTPASGDAARNDLTVADGLAPGPHRFVLTWDAATRAKALYIDGSLASAICGPELPADLGATIELGRFAQGAAASGVRVDELAIYRRALAADEVAALGQHSVLPPAATSQASFPLVAHAADDAGGIVSVQLGVNGVFGDPQPYRERYDLLLPASGTYTITARFLDRAGNSASAETQITYTPPKVYLPLVMQHP
ncbi:peptidoglycan DD-metalloendopeptidase family protein [Chloroflexia bacterium SDU3-3]|nr:peptidoglycan DD-metalloendopeptidase family protein [Chloroflexia bacterium SDU3-3]